jgi:hypothetical protein
VLACALRGDGGCLPVHCSATVARRWVAPAVVRYWVCAVAGLMLLTLGSVIPLFSFWKCRKLRKQIERSARVAVAPQHPPAARRGGIIARSRRTLMWLVGARSTRQVGIVAPPESGAAPGPLPAHSSSAGRHDSSAGRHDPSTELHDLSSVGQGQRQAFVREAGVKPQSAML